MLVECIAIGLGITLIMLAAWVFQAWRGNAGWVDVFWTFGTGLVCALVAAVAGPVPWRRTLVAGLLLIWCVRLGSHIAVRVAHGVEDTRYARMRAASGPKFQWHMLGLILPQGAFSGILAITVLFAARLPVPGVRLWDVLAILLALVALGGEALADAQLRWFRADPANKGKICAVGLWRASRHPNYLFEFLGWCAYPLLGVTLNEPWSLLSLAAPLLMFLTLRFASGVPPLEAAMLASRGAAYRDYQARTGAILPRLWPRRP